MSPINELNIQNWGYSVVWTIAENILATKNFKNSLFHNYVIKTHSEIVKYKHIKAQVIPLPYPHSLPQVPPFLVWCVSADLFLCIYRLKQHFNFM